MVLLDFPRLIDLNDTRKQNFSRILHDLKSWFHVLLHIQSLFSNDAVVLFRIPVPKDNTNHT